MKVYFLLFILIKCTVLDEQNENKKKREIEFFVYIFLFKYNKYTIAVVDVVV